MQSLLGNELHVGTSFPHREAWLKILKEWQVVLGSYVSQRNIGLGEPYQDLPYWYNEWASASFLAGAVWRLQGSVLSEGSFVSKPGHAQGAQYPKRCDLWFRIEGSTPFTCSLEAKQIWPGIATHEAVSKVKEALSIATDQLRRLGQDDCGDYGVAVCFVAPMIKGSKDNPGGAFSEWHRLFDLITKEYRTSEQILVAYEPPELANTFWEDSHYPGVALVGQVVKW